MSLNDKLECVKIKLDDKRIIFVNKAIYDVLYKKITDKALLNSILVEFDELKTMMDAESQCDSVDVKTDSDTKSDDSKNIKRKLTKHNIFEKDRNELLCKMNKILGFSDDGGDILVMNITPEMEASILKLAPDIKYYFKCGTWSYFREPKVKLAQPSVSIIKALYRDMGYDVSQPTSYKVINGVKTKMARIIVKKQ